jgi:hypothetical protein
MIYFIMRKGDTRVTFSFEGLREPFDGFGWADLQPGSQPSGAACTLLAIASSNPKAILDVVAA